MKFKLLLLLWVIGSPVMSQALESGLAIGTDCPAFDPYHISGPDKGTRACPMCKYGYQQGVMVWINDSNWESLSQIAKRLEVEINLRGIKKMRAFIIYMNPEERPLDEVMKKLTDLAREAKLGKAALLCIPGPTDLKSAKMFKINPDKHVRNTVLIYKSRKVFDKYINLETTELDKVIASFDKALKTKSF